MTSAEHQRLILEEIVKLEHELPEPLKGVAEYWKTAIECWSRARFAEPNSGYLMFLRDLTAAAEPERTAGKHEPGSGV